jgi:hypothetical protein
MAGLKTPEKKFFFDWLIANLNKGSASEVHIRATL